MIVACSVSVNSKSRLAQLQKLVFIRVKWLLNLGLIVFYFYVIDIDIVAISGFGFSIERKTGKDRNAQMLAVRQLTGSITAAEGLRFAIVRAAVLHICVP